MESPQYDYSLHTRREQTLTIHPASVIVLEGILLLSNPALREICDVRFYMDTPLDICLLRRIERDILERGRSLESVLEQYQTSVRPMYERFVQPSSRHADMLITGGGTKPGRSGSGA